MGFLMSNWKLLVALFAFVGYVVIQHLLYVALLRACREFRAALESSDRTRDAGGFVWLQDVRDMFAKGNSDWIDNSPLPRDAVIDSLDNELWRTSRYSALQRWGLAAPLIGVILSALGFMVSPPELTGEVKDIMTKLGPLFAGVFVGALMALVNQIYLHFAALELGRLRAKAVRWFDEVIWKAIRQNANNALGQATAETQAAAKYLGTSSQQLATCNITYRDSLLELNRQLGLVRDAAQVTSSTFDTFSKTFGEMTEQIRGSIRNLTALNQTAAAVENSGTIWNAASESVTNASLAIEHSSQKLLETCSNFSTNFDDVRNSMKEGLSASTGGLIDVVNKLAEPLQKLEGSIEQMHANTERHSELSTALTTAAQQAQRIHLEHQALNADEADLQREMASRVQVSIESLRKLTDTVSAVDNTGAALNQAAGGLRESSATIEKSLQTLFDTCNAFSTHSAEVQASLSRGVADATAGLQKAAQDLVVPIQSLSDSVARTTQSTEAEKRMESVEQRLDKTSQILSDSASAMRQLQGGLDTLVSELRADRAAKDAKGARWFPWLSKPRNAENTAVLQNGPSGKNEG